MDTQHQRITEARAQLDTLFTLRVALAELPQERDAAILRQLPPDLQETIAGIIREFRDLQDIRTSEEQQLAGEIRVLVRALGMPVIGTHLQASYGAGRRSWDTDRLLALAERYPEIHECLSQGEPIVSIRARAQRQQSAPLLYDVH